MLTAQSVGKCQKTILLKSCTTSQRAPPTLTIVFWGTQSCPIAPKC